jgi:hypothetical protein
MLKLSKKYGLVKTVLLLTIIVVPIPLILYTALGATPLEAIAGTSSITIITMLMTYHSLKTANK